MKSRSFEDSAERRSGFLSEKRIYLKSGGETRFVRLRTRDQLLACTAGVLMLGWTVAATALATVQFVNGPATQEQAAEDRAVYETRVTALAAERDRRHKEALAAQEQFATLLSQLSSLQDRIFEAELLATEKTDEVASLTERLHTARSALDSATRQLAMVTDGTAPEGGALPDATLSIMTEALGDMATERDGCLPRSPKPRPRSPI